MIIGPIDHVGHVCFKIIIIITITKKYEIYVVKRREIVTFIKMVVLL